LRADADYIRLALRLAKRGYGATSPNPMVGALLVKDGKIIGRGWHHHAGAPHAEIEALRQAREQNSRTEGATLFVTLEPCCTQGRTPPCTDALIAAGIKRVVAGAIDLNPKHSGNGFKILTRSGISVTQGILASTCAALNEPFNHWIVHGTPLVTVKAAMTLDGKIATASGESKWITGPPARRYAMELRQGADAILVGINTVLADDPSLTWRAKEGETRGHLLRRIVLDAHARTPLNAKVASDEYAALTTIVVCPSAPKNRRAALANKVRVLVAPNRSPGSRSRWGNKSTGARGPAVHEPTFIDLPWLLRTLGSENVTHLLVEGGGEVNASFLLGKLGQRIAFFYSPKILGGRKARHATGGVGARSLEETLDLHDVRWRRLGEDWLLNARVGEQQPSQPHV